MRRRDERGQVGLLILALVLVALLLVTGTVALTSANLSRMRLLDAADGAALAAANALDSGAYERGLGAAVPLTDASVQEEAAAYLSGRPLPVGMEAWGLASPTGSPDGQTAQVSMRCTADLPLVGRALSALGGSVTITVTSRARARVQ